LPELNELSQLRLPDSPASERHETPPRPYVSDDSISDIQYSTDDQWRSDMEESCTESGVFAYIKARTPRDALFGPTPFAQPNHDITTHSSDHSSTTLQLHVPSIHNHRRHHHHHQQQQHPNRQYSSQEQNQYGEEVRGRVVQDREEGEGGRTLRQRVRADRPMRQSPILPSSPTPSHPTTVSSTIGHHGTKKLWDSMSSGGGGSGGGRNDTHVESWTMMAFRGIQQWCVSDTPLSKAEKDRQSDASSCKSSGGDQGDQGEWKEWLER
jgi:hypothetical protein